MTRADQEFDGNRCWARIISPDMKGLLLAWGPGEPVGYHYRQDYIQEVIFQFGHQLLFCKLKSCFTLTNLGFDVGTSEDSRHRLYWAKETNHNTVLLWPSCPSAFGNSTRILLTLSSSLGQARRFSSLGHLISSLPTLSKQSQCTLLSWEDELNGKPGCTSCHFQVWVDVS